MSRIEIMPAEKAHLTELVEIERAADELFPAERLPSGMNTRSESQLLQGVEEQLLWIAALKERICGFALAQRQNDWLHLEQVSVHPRAGRRGIGRSLVERVMSSARDQQLQGVSLTTFSDFSWNAPFYRSIGFVEWSGSGGFLEAQLSEQTAAGMTDRVAMTWTAG
jgi:N-acetylglutamate synthase-like GNAT family acetyltransferase